MHNSVEQVETITSKQLRRLPIDYPEEDIYDKEHVLTLEDNDEISPEECGFMLGYLEAEIAI